MNTGIARKHPDYPAGHALLRLSGASSVVSDPRLKILRVHDQPVLGPDGWQAGEAWLQPMDAMADGDDLVLTLGPDIVQYLEEGTLEVLLPGMATNDSYVVSWPVIPQMRSAGSGPVRGRAFPAAPIRPAPPPPKPEPEPEPAPDEPLTLASDASAPAEELPPPPTPEPAKKKSSALLVILLLLLILATAGAGAAYYFGLLDQYLNGTEEQTAPPTQPDQEPPPAQPDPEPPPPPAQPDPEPPPPPPPQAEARPCTPEDGRDPATLAARDIVAMQGCGAGDMERVAEGMQQAGRHDDALLLLETLAERNHAPAMTALARLYDPNGFTPGRPFSAPDARQAAKLYQQAVRVGDNSAEAPRAALRTYLEQRANDGDTTARLALQDFWP